MKRRYQLTATTITSVGNRNPANADVGGNHGRERVDDFTAQACLDLANAQCNGAVQAMVNPLLLMAGHIEVDEGAGVASLDPAENLPDPLARELNLMLSPDSPLTSVDRELLRAMVDRLMDYHRVDARRRT